MDCHHRRHNELPGGERCPGQWGGFFAAKQKGKKGWDATVTTQSLTDPSSPSKEYIYAGGRLIATEEPPPSQNCTYTFVPTFASLPSAATSSSFSVNTQSGCAWTATTTDSFITITAGSGTGTGMVSFSVTQNTGSSRTGTISVAGQTFTIYQAGTGSSGSIYANPNPIQVCDGTGLGVTTINWSTTNTSSVEVRVGSPTGALFANTTSGPWPTGKWVVDGTVFYLQDTTSGSTTLATVTVNLTTNGCGGSIPSPPSGLTATPASSSQINLNWVDTSNNELGFKLERKIGLGGTYTQIATPGANVISYLGPSLLPSTTYYYRPRDTTAQGIPIPSKRPQRPWLAAQALAHR